MRNKAQESQVLQPGHRCSYLGSVLPCSGGSPLSPWAFCFPLIDCNRLLLAAGMGFAEIG